VLIFAVTRKESGNVAVKDENPSTRDFPVDGGSAGGGGECTTRMLDERTCRVDEEE
jgi:hypothetical protein